MEKEGNVGRPGRRGHCCVADSKPPAGNPPTEIQVFVEVFSVDPLLDNRILDGDAISSL
jgi:hypothetical protein